MLRHRKYTRSIGGPTSAALDNVVSVGGVNCGALASFPTFEMTEVKSIIDEVNVDRQEKACDSYTRIPFQATGPLSYATSSNVTTPWSSYCVWTGRIARWRRFWDNPISGSTVGSYAFGPIEDPVQGLRGHAIETSEGTMEIVVPDEVDGLIAKSLNTMLPAIKSEMSLPNSIIEIKDVRQLRHSYNKVSSLLKRVLVGTQIRGNSTYKDKTLKALIRTSSDAYLQKSFALDPLIADVGAIRKVLAQTEARVREILKDEGRVLVKHFSARLQGYDTETKQATGTMPSKTYYLLQRDVTYPTARFNATLVYSYRLTEYERTHASTLALLDAFGVNWRPSIVWNAIPFSFMVDWFVDIGRWLDNLQLRNIEPINELHSYVWSVKIERTVNMGIHLNPPSSGQPTMTPYPVQTHGLRETYYKRVPLSRVSMYDSLKTSGLSLKELSLALALKFS